jgi:predicted ATPase
MSTLRKALGEKPCDHRYIETIPKTGYRFVAPVRHLDYQPPTGFVAKPPRSCSHPLVGREAEREALHQAYDQAQQDHGRIVCISGDVGLGKTALVDTFIEELRHEGQAFHVAHGRCSESLTESEPFIPWIESLSALAGEPTVRDVMVQAAPTWYREIMHTGTGGPRKMKRELLDFCKQMSPVHPLIIAIDDFHWSDAESADLLSYLATRLERTRVLIVVCYDLSEMKIKNHPFLRLRSDLLSRRACSEIRLAPLNRNQVEQYLGVKKPNEGYPADYPELLHAKSEGNPLFLEELLAGHNEVNDSIRHMIQAKLDRIDDTHRQLLVTASVQGREFDSAVLASTMLMPSQDVEETLQELDEVYGLIQRIREEELPDGKFTVRYRFVHRLYQEACYASLAPSRKAALSAKLAEAFLTYYGG